MKQIFEMDEKPFTSSLNTNPEACCRNGWWVRGWGRSNPPPPTNVLFLCGSVDVSFKGSLTRDFRLQVSFMNQCPPGPQVFRWGRFEFFRKFAEIFANEYLSPVSLTPAINCSAVSTTPATNPCHGEITKKYKIFRRCQRHNQKTVHQSDKLFGGVNDTGD